MNHTVEDYKAKYPNLWRVAEELAKSKNPYKTLDRLLAVVAGEGMKGVMKDE